MHVTEVLPMTNPLLCVLVLSLTAAMLAALVLRYDPQRPHARWLRRGVTGLLLLTVWNLLPLPALGVNPLSVMVTGSLGIPGLGLVAVMNLLP